MAWVRGGNGVRLAAALLAGAFMISSAQATMPPLQWQGAERVAVLCQATAQSPSDNEIVTRALCERVAKIARRQAPVTVEIVSYGDPALSAANTVSLFVQAAVAEVAPDRLGLVVAARTERAAALEPASTYFGATPRVAPFTSAADGAAWDPILSASLAELLPWLRPAGTGE